MTAISNTTTTVILDTPTVDAAEEQRLANQSVKDYLDYMKFISRPKSASPIARTPSPKKFIITRQLSPPLMCARTVFINFTQDKK